MDKNKVVLGLSGGIDSCAAAIKLKEKGMNVIALYFDIERTANTDSLERAKLISKQLDIPFNYVNIHTLFKEKVIKPFCEAYISGLTPSPCMVCNPKIKWAILKKYADEYNAYYISSGHYADIVNSDNVFYVKKSINTAKDQSYMLAGLDQSILSRVLFPLSEFNDKSSVREYVNSNGIQFPNSVSESMDVCFIKTNYKDFLRSEGYTPKAGNFLDENGNIIGKHDSYYDYTIGQGKGFGMGFNKKVYVKSINPLTADVTLCNDDSLFSNIVTMEISNFAKYGNCNAIPNEYLNKEFDVKIRYAAKPAKAVLLASDSTDKAILKFEYPQRAAAPGQYAVLYDKDLVIACGIIC